MHGADLYSNIFASGYIVPDDRGFCKGLSGGAKSTAFPGCPVLEPARRASLWDCPGELGQPLGLPKHFLRKCQVLLLCKVIIFDLHLFYFGLVSYGTSFRQEQYVLESTGKFS